MSETGVCGDPCGLCPRYTATADGDTEKLRYVAVLWEKVGWRDRLAGPEEMACHGCTSVQWCRYDDIRQCARRKAIGNCGECNGYPCVKIMRVFEQTESYAGQCKEICTEAEFHCLQKAFFSKKANLDRIGAARS